MMKEHAVIVKLTAKDRPGLFNEIMMVLQNMGLDIQDGNIQTIEGERQDIFSVKVCIITTLTCKLSDLFLNTSYQTLLKICNFQWNGTYSYILCHVSILTDATAQLQHRFSDDSRCS
jgi:hypothetical protein